MRLGIRRRLCCALALPERLWGGREWADLYQLGCLNAPLRTVRGKANEISRLVDELEPPGWKRRDKTTYKFVNMISKPLLHKHGYKSLAHFERNGPAPPPRR